MNIFYLDSNPTICAAMHNDKHCVKMILETAQILSTAHHAYNSDNVSQLYKPTHKNHPSTVWARQSATNYLWLWHLLNELCKEYTHRYKKIHKVQCSGLLDTLFTFPSTMPILPFTEPPQAMPDDCKAHNTIQAYRDYYIKYKAHIAKWTNRQIPSWFK